MLMDNNENSPVAPGEIKQEFAPDETSENQAPEVEQNTSINQAPAAKKKSKAPLIITIIALLIICGGVVAFFLLKDQLFGGSSNNGGGRQEPPVAEKKVGGNALSDFDLALLKSHNEEENKIYSPISIKYALKMLSDGAKGDTKAEIDKVLGNYVANSYKNSKNRSFANALFVRNSKKDTILDSYIDGLKTNYSASVVYDDFANATNINKWISDNTLGIIKDMLEDGDVANVDFALVNALAIDMKWNYRLQCAYGDDSIQNKNYSASYAHEKYHAYINCIEGDGSHFGTTEFGDKKTEVKVAKIGASINRYDIVKELGRDKIREIIKPEYEEWLKSYDDSKVDEKVETFIDELDANFGDESTSTDFKMYYDEGVKAFAKDLQTYGDTTLQYVAIMPEKQSLKDYVKNSSADSIATVISKLYEIKKEYFKDGVITKIEGSIPFFKYDYRLDLVDDLQDLGIKKVFAPSEADLSGLSSEKGAAIVEVLHKADIEFSNDGIKAAATTVGGGAGAALMFEHLFDVPVETIDMTFNKPYLYLIRDADTGEVWFTGTVYEPQTEIEVDFTNPYAD